MSAQLPLSLCVITRDAAAQLADCLASAPFAGEIVVVDSGSSDDTVEIARRCGARVIVQPWQGFGPQKNFAVAQAAHDWVLCLDADERVTPELGAAIRAALGAAPAAVAFAVARRNRFLGRWLEHGEGYPDWIVRVFDRRHARWTDDPVHENVTTDGSVVAACGRPAARVGRIARRVHREAEPLHDAAGRGDARCAASARASRGWSSRRSRGSSASTWCGWDFSTASPVSSTSRSAASRAS